MKLTQLEIETPLWQKIAKEIDEQIDFQRQRNDTNLSVEETAKVRGTIAALKTIKSWAKQDPNIT